VPAHRGASTFLQNATLISSMAFAASPLPPALWAGDLVGRLESSRSPQRKCSGCLRHAGHPVLRTQRPVPCRIGRCARFRSGKLILKPTESYARIRVRKPGACRTLLFIKKWNQSLDVGEPEIDGEEPVGIQLQLLHLSLLSQNFLLFSLLHQLLNAC
jgi:hypothetical protein